MKNKNKIILDLCGGTGAWSKPYRDAGYDVRVITLPEFDINNTELDGECITFWSPMKLNYSIFESKEIYGIIGAPPCTMFSLARTTAKTPRDFVEGMRPVEMCMAVIWEARKKGTLKFWAIENPMGYMRQFLGKPAFTFDVSEFGADYNKKTDLWGYFNEPKMKRAYKRFASTDKNTRKLPPIPGDYLKDPAMNVTAIKRSITNGLFAQAFFKANQ